MLFIINFPGFGPNGEYLVPTQQQIDEYRNDELINKIVNYEKIIILGNIAINFLQFKLYGYRTLNLIHPSKRNFQKNNE